MVPIRGKISKYVLQSEQRPLLPAKLVLLADVSRTVRPKFMVAKLTFLVSNSKVFLRLLIFCGILFVNKK